MDIPLIVFDHVMLKRQGQIVGVRKSFNTHRGCEARVIMNGTEF
jgi:hypothetical protein